MAQFCVNVQRFDPYKSFRSRVKGAGRHVAGISQAARLKRATGVVGHREGGDPGSTRKSPGRTGREAITIERGVTHAAASGQWTNKVQNFAAGVGGRIAAAVGTGSASRRAGKSPGHRSPATPMAVPGESHFSVSWNP